MALAHKCGWSGRPIVVCSCAPCTKTVMHRHRTELYHVCAWNALFVGVGFGSWCFIFAHVSSSAWSMQPKIEIRWYNNAPSQGGCVSPTTKFHWVTWLAASGLGPFLWNLIWFRHWCHVLFPCGAKSQKRIANIIFTCIYLYLVYCVGLYAKHGAWMWNSCWAWMLSTGRNKRRILVHMRWVCKKRRFCLVIVLANIIQMWNGIGMTCATFRTLMCSKLVFLKNVTKHVPGG